MGSGGLSHSAWLFWPCGGTQKMLITATIRNTIFRRKSRSCGSSHGGPAEEGEEPRGSPIGGERDRGDRQHAQVVQLRERQVGEGKAHHPRSISQIVPAKNMIVSTCVPSMTFH